MVDFNLICLNGPSKPFPLLASVVRLRHCQLKQKSSPLKELGKVLPNTIQLTYEVV